MKKLFTIIFLFFFFFVQNVSAFHIFKDVSDTHQNAEAIAYLKNEEVIKGYADGTFKPAATISRAELLKIILLGNKIPVPSNVITSNFKDVSLTAWYAAPIMTAYGFGVVKGYANGTFRPDNKVTLAEALKILLETYELAIKVKQPVARYTPIPDVFYTEVPKNEWYSPYFAYAKTIKLFDVDGFDSLKPNLLLTRSKMAEMMFRLATMKEWPSQVTVKYTANGFSPAIIHVKVNGKVTFKNETDFTMWIASNSHPTHTLYPVKGGCISSLFDQCKGVIKDQEWTFTFNQVGTWKYHNHLKSQDTGTVIVEE